MVSLHEGDPETPPYRQYQTSVDDTQSTATMANEQPMAMSVQDRIRALNKEAAKPARVAPPPMKLRATAPRKVKAAASAPVRSGTLVENKRSTSADRTLVEPVAQPSPNTSMEMQEEIDVRDAEVRGQIDFCDAELHGGADNESHASLESRTNEPGESLEEREPDAGKFNTLHQFMMDSTPGDGPQSEVSDGDGQDFDASAALRYWRKSKGAGDADEDSGDEELDETTGTRDGNEDTVHSQDSQSNNAEASCSENTDNDVSSGQKYEQEVKSDLEITATETDEYLGEIEPLVQDIGDGFASLAVESDRGTDELGLQIDDSEESKPPCPPDILRTVHSYPDIDTTKKDECSKQAEPMSELEQNDVHTSLESGGLEQAQNEGELPNQGPEPGANGGANEEQQRRSSESTDETVENEKEKPDGDQSSTIEKSRHQPRTASTFSKRAFEKRSRMKAAQNAQSSQATGPKSPRVKDKARNDPYTAKGKESTTEVDNASVFSGSTTHSASTIHTTTLSSRATRLLRDKRKGNAKPDRLAKALAQNILRRKTTADDAFDDSTALQVGVAGDTPPDNVDNSAGVSMKYYNRRTGERQYSNNPNFMSPMDYQFQRQMSHVSHHSNISQHANPIQFGPSPSFQNVEVGITSGPTVYQIQHQQAIPQYISPAAPYAVYPNHSRVYSPIMSHPNNDLSVQPKFSRFNSFDVQNPKPAPIQNVLTEDSASWSESRTQDGTETVDDSAGGTQSSQVTPLESLGGAESLGMDRENIYPSTESIPQLDSFPKGRSFDKGCTVFDHIHNACDTLSPKSCNPEIVSNPTNELIHGGSTFSNTLSDEDVAIEVEYVERTDTEITEQQFDTKTVESDSVFSMSTRDLNSEDSYSYGNA